MNINPNKAFWLHYQIAGLALFKKNNGEPTCIISISISIKYYTNIIQTTFSLHANHNKHIIDTLHKRDTSMLSEQKWTKLQAENDDFIVREISAD